MADFGLTYLTVRRLRREAVRVADHIAQLGNVGEHRLKEEITSARASMRRAGGFHSAGKDPARTKAMAFLAIVCERELGAMPSPGQITGALAMHEGYLVELDACEGRALAIALAAVLFSWGGSPCHIVSSNDYLARRDASSMQPLFASCGCLVAALAHDTPPDKLAEYYGIDILYVASRQLLSDSVRDLLLSGVSGKYRRRLWEMRATEGERRPVMKGTYVALIDDAGAVMIEEATSPLVISAPGVHSVLEEATRAAHALVEEFQAGRDYTVELEPQVSIRFTLAGEHLLSTRSSELPPYWRLEKRRQDVLTMAILARDVFKRDRHYAMQEQRISILDDNIQRLCAGHSWYFGVIQAIEAREGMPFTVPPRTIARTAFQEFFPRYDRLAGAGSELSEFAREFAETYDMRLLRLSSGIPPKPRMVRRYDFATRDDKIDAFLAVLQRFQRDRSPVLVFTQRAKDSAAIVERLAREGIESGLLDGKDPDADARTLSIARRPGGITVVTGTAGRSANIPAGSDVGESAALQVLVFEHADSRRADNLLLSWVACQAMSREVQVFASLEDALLGKVTPLWGWPLRHLAKSAACRRICVSALVYLSQRTTRLQAYRYRKVVLQREEQLDQQLAFFKRLYHDSKGRF